MPPKKKTKAKAELKCSKCDYTTHRKAFMDDHMRIHTGDRPYKCNECGKGFTQKSNLTKHMIVHGSGYKTEYKCDRCDFTTRYKQSLKMHQNWHGGVKPYVCDICERSFSQSTHRRTHMKEAHDDERKYQCHLCSKCFKRKEHLDKHIAFHRNERNYSCDICGKTFIEEKHVSIHKLIHGGDETKVHKCDLCPYKSRYKQGLQVHYRIHLGVRPYRCEQCPKAFRTSQTLRIHTRMVHQGLMGKIFHCDMCDYRTANKQTLKKHLENIHMGIKKKNAKYPCPYCGHIYLGHSSLHGHKRKKHPQKLKQEMQSRLQQRLAMIRSPDGKLHAQTDSNTSDAIEDYRFKNPVHNSLRQSMVIKLDLTKGDTSSKKGESRIKGKKKPGSPKRQKAERENPKVKRSLSEKKRKGKHTAEKVARVDESSQSNAKESNQCGQEEVTQRKVSPGASKRSTKKPVHDLIQERIAKKKELANANRSKACKKIDFPPSKKPANKEIGGFTEEITKGISCVMDKKSKNISTNKEAPGSNNLSKESYMSNLGLFHKDKPGTSLSVVPNGSDMSNGTTGTDVNGVTDQVPVIVIQPLGIITSTPDKRKDPLHFPRANLLQTPKRTSPKKAGSLFPQIKPLNLSTRKKENTKKSAPKSPKGKNKTPPSVPKPPRKKSVQKSKALQQDPSRSSLIVYEPVDVPSLGPYTRVEETAPSVVDVSPVAGTRIEIPEIKQETEDYMTVPLNYSMNEYDSLRALASVYLEKSTA